jgi:glutaredoxin
MAKEEKRLRRMQARLNDEHERRRRMFWMSIAGTGIGSTIIVGFLVAWNLGWIGSREPHPYDAFAQCLTDAGVVMYGTDWCPHCQAQKKLFDDAFDYVNYVNCDFNQKLCKDKNIKGYPTWYKGYELLEKGEVTFEQLSEASGCQAPK